MSSTLLRRRLGGGLLSKLLEDPQLAPELRALPAPALRQVILRVGLEDTSVLAAWASDPSEGDLLEKVLDAQLTHELDDHLLVSRTELGWDAVLATLLALDERQPELLRGVLRRCAIAAHEQVEGVGEFCAALRGEDLLLEDARAEREERRAERGYVSAADARAFLALARTAPDTPKEDPITRAHFRELKPVVAAGPSAPPAGALPRPPPLRQLLAEAGVEPDAQLAPAAEGSLFRRTLGELLERDPDAHQRVVEELAYLANVLIAGDASAARTWRPVEAAERVLDLCDEGLRSLAGRGGSDPAGPLEALLRWGAVGVFRVAWASKSSGG